MKKGLKLLVYFLAIIIFIWIVIFAYRNFHCRNELIDYSRNDGDRMETLKISDDDIVGYCIEIKHFGAYDTFRGINYIYSGSECPIDIEIDPFYSHEYHVTDSIMLGLIHYVFENRIYDEMENESACRIEGYIVRLQWDGDTLSRSVIFQTYNFISYFDGFFKSIENTAGSEEFKSLLLNHISSENAYEKCF
jgi:hypothetical protein